MRHGYGEQRHGVSARAARAALRFAARRSAPNRRDAWRPVALLWKQKRKRPEGAPAQRGAQDAATVWAPHIHLHFSTGIAERTTRYERSSLFSVMHQRRDVIEHQQRTIVQSRRLAAQKYRPYSPVRVVSLREARGEPGTNVRDTDSYAPLASSPLVAPALVRAANRAQSAARLLSPLRVRSDSGTNAQGASHHASSAHRPIFAPAAVRSTNPAQHPNLGQPRPRERFGADTAAHAQTYRTPRTYQTELHLFRPHSGSMDHSLRVRSQESTARQLAFSPVELLWRRAVQPVAEDGGSQRPLDSREPVHPAHDRSSPQQAASVMSHPSRQPAANLKIDASLIDRLADDVIHRVEKRARIDRARRGL
jgi:hypothetical protein